MPSESAIWDKVKRYMLIDGDAFYFPVYLFIESKKKIKVSEEEDLKPEDFQNKSRIFDVVYDRVGYHLGEPLEVRREGKYLKFSSEKSD